MYAISIGTRWQSFSDGMLKTNLREKTHPSNGRSRAEHLREVNVKRSGRFLGGFFQMERSVFRRPKFSWFYLWFIYGLSMVYPWFIYGLSMVSSMVYPGSLAMRQCLPDDQGYG